MHARTTERRISTYINHFDIFFEMIYINLGDRMGKNNG